MVKNEFALTGFTGQEVEKIVQALSLLPYRDVAGIIMKVDRQMIEQTQETIQEDMQNVG